MRQGIVLVRGPDATQSRETQGCFFTFISFFFFFYPAVLFILSKSHEKAQSTDIGVEEMHVRKR